MLRKSLFSISNSFTFCVYMLTTVRANSPSSASALDLPFSANNRRSNKQKVSHGIHLETVHRTVLLEFASMQWIRTLAAAELLCWLRRRDNCCNEAFISMSCCFRNVIVLLGIMGAMYPPFPIKSKSLCVSMLCCLCTHACFHIVSTHT